MFQETVTILRSAQVAENVYTIEFASERIARATRPGQFLNGLTSELTTNKWAVLAKLLATPHCETSEASPGVLKKALSGAGGTYFPSLHRETGRLRLGCASVRFCRESAFR